MIWILSTGASEAQTILEDHSISITSEFCESGGLTPIPFLPDPLFLVGADSTSSTRERRHAFQRSCHRRSPKEAPPSLTGAGRNAVCVSRWRRTLHAPPAVCAPVIPSQSPAPPPSKWQRCPFPIKRLRGKRRKQGSFQQVAQIPQLYPCGGRKLTFLHPELSITLYANGTSEPTSHRGFSDK